MNKCLGAAVMGFLMGLYLGYMKDEEIEDLCHQSKKAEKKMKRITIRRWIKFVIVWIWINPTDGVFFYETTI